MTFNYNSHSNYRLRSKSHLRSNFLLRLNYGLCSNCSLRYNTHTVFYVLALLNFEMHKFQLLGSRSAPLYYFVLPRDCNFDLFRSGNSMEDSSPLREESGCGAGIFHLSSSSSLGGGSAGSPTSPSTTPFNKTVRLLVGSKHHFDLVKIHLGPPNVSSDTMRILALASGSSFGAISATEVRFFRKLMPHN